MKDTTKKIMQAAVNYCYSWDRELAYEYLRKSFKGNNRKVVLDLWDHATEYPWQKWGDMWEEIL